MLYCKVVGHKALTSLLYILQAELVTHNDGPFHDKINFQVFICSHGN